MMIDKERLTAFVAGVQAAYVHGEESCGTWFYKLDDKYYAVFAAYADDEDVTLHCKVAYNCDDLQCDYDFDWNMPEKDGEVIDTEERDIEFISAEAVADEIIENYKNIKEALKNA